MIIVDAHQHYWQPSRGDYGWLAHAPVAFLDPADTGETRLMGRHGSLTPAEMAVPLVAFAPA